MMERRFIQPPSVISDLSSRAAPHKACCNNPLQFCNAGWVFSPGRGAASAGLALPFCGNPACVRQRAWAALHAGGADCCCQNWTEPISGSCHVTQVVSHKVREACCGKHPGHSVVKAVKMLALYTSGTRKLLQAFSSRNPSF